MDCSYLLTFSVILQVISGYYSDEAREYCMFETFEAHCGEGSVIQMNRAMFGRMSLGRCIRKDYGYIGCGADILYKFDENCSGRRICSETVQSLFNLNPCVDELIPYLEASYSCVEVVTPPPVNCSTGSFSVSATEGAISSLVSKETGYGYANCPIILIANLGQIFSLTLIDFDSNKKTEANRYATIDEGFHTVGLLGGFERESTNPIVIESPVIQITLESDVNFIVKFEVHGCPDPIDEVGTHSKRDGDTLEVICDRTGEVSHLTCDEETNDWVGERADCREGCPVWATPEGYTIANYGDKVVITCETTGEFMLLECQGKRWIQKYPIEDETEISFPPCS